MSNLIVRAITGIIVSTLFIALTFYSPYGLMGLCVMATFVGLWEFYRLFGLAKIQYIVPTFGLVGFAWSLFLFPFPPHLLFALAILLTPVLGALLLFDSKHKSAAESFGVYILGITYCVIPVFVAFLIGFPEHWGEVPDLANYNPWLPFTVCFLVGLLDTAAYFFGRYLGKRPLYERISPKKTWAGAIGGGLTCIVAGGVFDYLAVYPEVSWTVAAMIIAVVSQVGDLTESMLKRSQKIKDSGGILPGHGGMLDRLDGMYFSFPAMYLYFYIVSLL